MVEPTSTAIDDPELARHDRLAGLAPRYRAVETLPRSRRRWGVLLPVLVFVGFVCWWHILRPIQQHVDCRMSLAGFGRLYQAFQRDAGRSPRNIDELENFVQLQSAGQRATDRDTARLALGMARDGRLEVVWDAWSVRNAPYEYLAREPKVVTEGGFVLWPHATAEYFSAAQYSYRRPSPVRTWNR